MTGEDTTGGGCNNWQTLIFRMARRRHPLVVRAPCDVPTVKIKQYFVLRGLFCHCILHWSQTPKGKTRRYQKPIRPVGTSTVEPQGAIDWDLVKEWENCATSLQGGKVKGLMQVGNVLRDQRKGQRFI